ncbi:MAG: MoaD/ThiS family protein [Rhodocyclaceae bacterium]|nr:MoaD/ThiS family protein [Rhodocyclaceae bacterium]
MRVIVPSPLHSYTGGRSECEASGATLDALLADMDRQHPGLRFRIVDEQQRIRVHIRIYVNRKPATELAQPLAASDEVLIVAALSGG